MSFPCGHREGSCSDGPRSHSSSPRDAVVPADAAAAAADDDDDDVKWCGDEWWLMATADSTSRKVLRAVSAASATVTSCWPATHTIPVHDKALKVVYSSQWWPISALRSVTCHIGLHSVTCHPTPLNAPSLNPNQTDRYSIYLLRRDGRLSWPWWLVNQCP